MSSRPRILYVNHLPAFPTTYGGQIRVAHIAKALQAVGDVSHLCLPEEISQEQQAALKHAFDRAEIWPQAGPPNATGFIGLQRRRLHVLTEALLAPAAPRADRQRFASLRREFDLVWFEQIMAAERLRLTDRAGCFLDLDDLHYQKFEQMTQLETTFVRRMRAAVQAWGWRRRELALLPGFDGVGVCSEEDRSKLGGGDHIHVIPNGFAAPSERPAWTPRTQTRLGFIGNIGYLPNRDGLAWFAREVWPLVREAAPSAVLRVVGKRPPNAAFLDTSGFECLGFVDDAFAEMQSWCASIVPLRIGGGTRIKILEAFSRRVPVVSTTLGAYGLDAQHDRELLLGDDPASMAAACVSLLQNPERGEALTAAGWELFESRFTWERINARVAAAVHATLQRRAK